MGTTGERFPKLFEAIKIRHKALRNRIVFGPHTVAMAIDGLPSERHLAYYRERARGGAGMIVVEPVPAHRTGVLIPMNFRHEDDSVIPHFRKVTDACHEEGAVICHQIYHVGQHGDQYHSFEPYWSPSGLPSFHDWNGSHAVSESEIEELIEAFVQAARRDKEAGFDGVEIYAAYNSLLDQFWSPLTNKRDDRWGGSLENRLRLTTEILGRVRRTVGEDFIIGLTVSGAEPYPGGLAIEDKQEIAAYLDERGLVDYFSCGAGSYLNRFSHIVPSFLFDMMLGPPDAQKYKEAVNYAKVTAEARIKTPANAEKVIETGMADMVSLVRSQIADPHLANKAKAGRSEDIRPCISCNQLCIGRRLQNTWISCLVNPSAGREYLWDGDRPAPTEKPRRVLVVGGGPGGLEAARVAAERGHRVTLAERLGELGGQFRLAAGQPFRGEITQLLGDYYPRQLEKLQVEVLLHQEMNAEKIIASGADVVVLATGSVPAGNGFQRALPHVDRLRGVELENVFSVNAVLEGTAQPGSRVLLLDDLNGWWPASGTALHLAKLRHQVTLVTAAEIAAASLAYSLTDAETRALFVQYGIETLTSTAIVEWHGDRARLLNLITEEVEERGFDSLVLATTNRPDDTLAKTLPKSGIEVHAIGDCVSARTAAMAIFEGRKLALSL